jgi:hypothetical protein
MRRTLASLLSTALASFAGGCGNDDTDPPPYGGEVLVEHIQMRSGGEYRRLSAFFVASQDPDVAPEVPLGQCTAGRAASWQPDAREYIDVGDEVTFHLGDADFVVPRLEDAVDAFDRHHDIAYLREVGDPIADGFLMAEHTVTTAEPQSFSDQLRVFQPPLMQVNMPGDSIPFEFDRGADVEISWTHSQPVEGLTVDILVEDLAEIVSCRVADTGHFTVPADVFAGFESNEGILIVASVSRATAVTDAGRVIDVRAEYHGNLIPWHRTP